MIDFNNLGFQKEIIESLKKLDYKEPTPVQQQVIPSLCKDLDIIVKSKTGSGKTAAFALPIANKVNITDSKPQALILTPTRELAVQIAEEFSLIGRYKKIRVSAIYGQQPIAFQVNQLKQRVHVVVATPGRLLDHIKRQSIVLTDIKYLVIDEADEMLKMGFISQIEAIVKRLPKKRVTTLFSATMPNEIKNVASKYMKNPKEIIIENLNEDKKSIQQHYYISKKSKLDTLTNVIYVEQPKQCLIFCNTREKVNDVVSSIQKITKNVASLHGGHEQRERLYTIESFKSGKIRFLVATDILSRGIHIDHVSHVINYELPYEDDVYIHRIGRTGRAGHEGIALSILNEREMYRLKRIEEALNVKVEEKLLPSDDELNKLKTRYNEVLKEKLKLKHKKSHKFDKGINMLRINGGKDKKLSPGHVLGTLLSIDGVEMNDIGIIDLKRTCTYVEIFNNKSDMVLNEWPNKLIKGKKISIKKIK